MSEIKKIKPALSKGTRDFLPVEVAKRNYIFDTIKSVFRKYGFEEIETPAIERLETLTGKYGEEGDKLLFKILNSGNPLEKLDEGDIEIIKTSHALYMERKFGLPGESLMGSPGLTPLSTDGNDSGNLEPYPGYGQIISKLTEKGLRYDLTVPLARYFVQYQKLLAFPFKRFHIGPVWRADRPQKGRYQEFYQCDADIIGSDSLINEAELIMIYAEVFKLLGIKVWIRINSRKLLQGIAELLNVTDAQVFATIVDKLDKLGVTDISAQLVAAKVLEEMEAKEFERLVIESEKSKTGENIRFGLIEVIELFKTNFAEKKIDAGVKGCEELLAIFQYLDIANRVDLQSVLEFDRFLARGLNYYTGAIVEVISIDHRIGSLGGGGRYDNLTEMFGAKNMTGVGISFGIERIYDVMEELNLFPETISEGVKVLFVPREPEMETFAFQQAQALRNEGIGAEVFLGNVKKQKHFKYVEDKQIRYIVEVGGDEKASGKFRLRNVQTRDTQSDLSLPDLIAFLQS